MTVEAVTIPPAQRLDNLLANLLLSQAAAIIDENDATVGTIPAQPTTAADMIVEFGERGWHVIEVEVKA